MAARCSWPAGSATCLAAARVFLAGLALFTVASLLCGLAPSQGLLIGARSLQGVAAAGDSAMILAILVTLFADPRDTARAVGIYTFVAVSGGTIGLLVGGVLTQAISWHWIFFINLPIGLATLVLGTLLIPDHQGTGLRQGVDVLGALFVTATPALAVYTIIQASDNGWDSTRTLALAGAALAHGALSSSRSRRGAATRWCRCVSSALARSLAPTWCGPASPSGCSACSSWVPSTCSACCGYGALETGFAFLPLTLMVAVFSLFITRRVVARLGARTTVDRWR